MLLIHGKRDTVVPARQSLDFAKALEQTGASERVDVVCVPSDHSAFLLDIMTEHPSDVLDEIVHFCSSIEPIDDANIISAARAAL